MECIEARALKSSFLSQMAMKTNSHVFYNDDGWCFTGINSVTSDDFPVEDLLNLDFPEKELQEGCVFQESEEDDEKKFSQKRIPDDSDTFSGELHSVSAGELAVPADDLENLEWLSQFVDDSTSGMSLLCPAGNFTGKNGGFCSNSLKPLNKTVVQKVRPPCFPLPVHKKPRSKRPRSYGQPWSLASLPLSATESSSTSLSSFSSSPLSPFVSTNLVRITEWFSGAAEKPPAKKQKRRVEADGGSFSGRRCTHCQVQKTPQWRTGPLGPKTLCNACGVRFKSGRLFPEYRPACSPSFSQEIHSNSHRKVLEMRRKKENLTEPGLTPMVQSF